MENLTPYQGPLRRFGCFICPKCNKSWQSGNSWANTGQKCQKCSTMVYPYKQKALLKDPSLDDRPHQEDLCGKCIQLGHPCTDGFLPKK